MSARAMPAGLEPVVVLWPDARLSRRPGRARGLLVLPRARAPRVLVPTGVPGAARMLRRFSRGRAQSAARGVLAAGVRTGVLAMLPTTRLVTAGGAATVEEHVRRTVPGTHAVGVLLGPPRANAKPVLQVFGSDGATLAFGKVGHTPSTAALVRHEAEVLADPGLRGLSHVQPPEVLDAGGWSGLDVLLTTALPAAQSGTQSWDLPVEEMREVALSAPGERAAVGGSAYWLDLVDRVGGLRGAPGADLAALVDRVGPQVASTVLGLGRWHGDWSPWNSGRHAGRLQVWDWEQSGTGVPLGLDPVHFTLQRVFHEGAGAERAASMLGEQVFPVLEEWHGTSGAGRATALLYVIEVMVRYATQAGGDLGPGLAVRWQVLSDLADRLLAVPERARAEGRA